MNRRDDLHDAIDQVVTPRPDQNTIYQTRVPEIPRKGERAYEYTDNGLVIRRELTDKDWHTIHSEIRAVTGASRALNVGDATLYGLERGKITTLEEAAELFATPVDSIKVYVSICRNVPQLIRVNSLTFKHYRYIAPLPDDEKVHWINFAAAYNISSSNLKALIDQVNPPQLPADTSPVNGDSAPVDTTSPAPFDDIEEEATSLDTIPLTDKVHRQRMNTVWKKVETDALTVQDLPEVIFMRQWCDRVIKDFNRRK